MHVRWEVADCGCYAGVELGANVSSVIDKKGRRKGAKERTAARRARWPPRHMPVEPMRPVQVGKVKR